MVFPDSSDGKHTPPLLGKTPAVSDRILAFALDFAFVMPICQVLVAPLWRRIETLLYTSPRSVELMVAGLTAFSIVFVFAIAYQTIFLHLLGATPGKFFLKLRVISIETGTKPNWGAAFTRSLTWCVELVLFFGAPFLEVLGQRHRRGAHDRLSETMVITLKTQSDAGPHPLEIKFVRQILVLLTAVTFMWVGTAVVRLYEMGERGEFSQKELEADDYLCERVAKNSKNRTDEALALFLLGQVDEDCVERESDFALWTQSEELHSWAYLAQSFLNQSDRKISDEYLKEACKEKEGEACELSKKISVAENDSGFVWSSLTARVLHLESLKRAGRFKEVLASVKRFPVEGFREALSEYHLKALWAMNRKEEARGMFQAQAIFTTEKFKKEEAAWMCFQEMQDGCDLNRTISSCDLLANQASFSSASQAWTSMKLRECRSQAADDSRLYAVDEPEFLDLYQAYRTEGREKKKMNLQRVAKQLGAGEMQNYALLELIQLSETAEDLKNVFALLESSKNRDWDFMGVAMKAFSKAYERREFEVAFELSQLVDEGHFQTWNLSRQLVMATYWAGKKATALAMLRKLPSEKPSREIASEKKNDWEEVRSALLQESK